MRFDGPFDALLDSFPTDELTLRPRRTIAQAGFAPNDAQKNAAHRAAFGIVILR